MPRRGKQMLSDYPDVLIDFAYDLNNETPEELTAGSDHIVYWRCSVCKGVYNNSPYHKVKDKSGCPYCQNKKVLKGLNDLESQRPDIMLHWNYNKNEAENIYPDAVMYCANKEVYWKCESGHSFKKRVVLITSAKSFHCPECDRIIAKQRKIDKERREISRQAQKEKQKKIFAEKEQKRLQIEELARQSAIRREEQLILQKQQNLQDMEKKKLLDNLYKKAEDKSNSAAIALINLESYWNDEANAAHGFDKENPNWKDMYYWKCKRGHTWRQHIAAMQKNPLCHICNAFDNSIAKKYPSIVQYYDEKKNHISVDKKAVNDTEYLWWKCQNGHSFVARVQSVLLHPKTGCMYCEKEKSIYSTDGWIGKMN